MFKRLSLLLAFPLIVWGGYALSGDRTTVEPSGDIVLAEASGEKSAIDAILEKLPGLSADEIKDAPVEGLYEIMMGPQIAYVTADGRYLIRGDIIDLNSNVNLTDQRLSVARAQMMAGLSEDDMIVFAPENVDHTITVFTDIDCGYCRKLHREMDQLHALGVKVQYLFFPRSGPNTASWSKADNVWCAADRNEALTTAKAGAPIADIECGATPIKAHYKLGQSVGLRGTPAIVTENGDLIAGYMPADKLVARLAAAKQTSAAVTK